MKRFINIASIVVSAIAAIVIACTFLTSYQFINVSYMFNSYLPIQVALGSMMGVWAIRFWIYETGNKRIIYSAISISLCLVLLFSMNYVK